jgi:hypothetical protein
MGFVSVMTHTYNKQVPCCGIAKSQAQQGSMLAMTASMWKRAGWNQRAEKQSCG